MLLKETMLFFNRHAFQVVWLRVCTICGGLVSFQESGKDRLYLHGSDGVCGFVVLTVTTITEEQMLICSRKFISSLMHVA